MTDQRFRIERVRRYNGTYEWILEFPPRCFHFWSYYTLDREGRLKVAHSSFESAVSQMNRALSGGLGVSQ